LTVWGRTRVTPVRGSNSSVAGIVTLASLGSRPPTTRICPVSTSVARAYERGRESCPATLQWGCAPSSEADARDDATPAPASARRRRTAPTRLIATAARLRDDQRGGAHGHALIRDPGDALLHEIPAHGVRTRDRRQAH